MSLYHDLSGLHRGDNDPMSHRPAWPVMRYKRLKLRPAPTIIPSGKKTEAKKP